MKLILCLAGILVSQAAFAAPHDGHGAPWNLIFWQVFNLTILLGALFYFLRQPVKNYFKERQASFVAAAEKSQAARAEAEAKYTDLQQKINDLDRSRADSLARAEAEASDLKKQILAQAQEMSARIRREAEITAKSEIMRAKRELHEQFAQEAVAAARVALSKDISAQDQSRLQSDFVKNIEGVRP